VSFDPEPVLDQLKDFQRATAEYVFGRMHDARSPSIRFLVADEVGLGKTLVAKGVIAQTIAHLQREGVERIDIVYVCSNAEIARQNIGRLNVLGEEDELQMPDRLTMLPIHSGWLAEGDVNFISFTPGTSFDLKGHLGTWRERAMVHLMLSEAWGSRRVAGRGAARVFQGGVRSIDDFEQRLKDFSRQHRASLDGQLVERFRVALEESAPAAGGRPGFEERFDDLRERFSRARGQWPEADLRARRQFVGDLRNVLAGSCVEQLEPDLVILDEFQRFKRLLQDDDPAGELAKDLFAYVDPRTGNPVRVLLLSATPYKMYTLADELADDDHYEDLVETVRFLHADDEARVHDLEGALRAFRDGLYLIGADGGAAALHARAEVENALRAVMVRTERLAATADRGGMLEARPTAGDEVTEPDVRSYVAIERLARALGISDPMELWKSAPYLLNFMEGYKLDAAPPAAEGGADGGPLRGGPPIHADLPAELLDQEGGGLLRLRADGGGRRGRRLDPRLRAVPRDGRASASRPDRGVQRGGLPLDHRARRVAA
jgi:hypothetical protein